MQTSAFRVEVIRFSLLVTLTVALLSVAIRLASHSDSPSASHLGAKAGPSASTSSPAQTQPSGPSAPSSSPLGATPSPRSTSSTPAGSSGSGGGGSGGSDGGSGGPGAQPVLPVTGDDAVKLIALSMVLIGGGALTVRASRR